jgi:hypothetical protein
MSTKAGNYFASLNAWGTNANYLMERFALGV